MKILITDATYKHALALSRHLKNYNPCLEIVGVSPYLPKLPSLFARHYSRFIVGKIDQMVLQENPNLIIPVGDHSVRCVAELQTDKAILPKPENLKIAFDKLKTTRLAEKLGIPVPRTIALKSSEECRTLQIDFPCVVKGSQEAGKNVIAYPRNHHELLQAVEDIAKHPTQHNFLPIIQEYVSGTGLGFFGFYQKGQLKRFYMHQRIREFPLSGGASTAAKTIYHPEAFAFGKKILDALEWDGVAMVEFKFDPQKNSLYLLEINPKFWGSTELGLAAGVNFGELLLRSMLKEDILPNLSPDAYKRLSFFWPFEGDLIALCSAKNWRSCKDYLKRDYQTNVRTNGLMLNLMRFAKSFKW